MRLDLIIVYHTARMTAHPEVIWVPVQTASYLGLLPRPVKLATGYDPDNKEGNPSLGVTVPHRANWVP
jgi:hypothetical protein